MALDPLGVLDLSIVTERLINMIKDTFQASGQTFATVTGSMPESVRIAGGCQVSVYLFHIAPDKFQRNSPVTGSRAVPIPYQPLGLELYYLITTYADKDYVQEQQAMSTVLRSFHETPIVKPRKPQDEPKQDFTLTMEVETSDELGRLWQAVSAPFRLSVVYKVSVVFITPPAPPALSKPPQRLSLAVGPSSLPYTQSGQVFGTLRTVAFTGPNGALVTFDASPATVAPSPPSPLPPQRFVLYGAGLNQGAFYQGPPPNPGTSHRVYLLFPDGAEFEVTSWKVPEVLPIDVTHPPQFQTDSRIMLDLLGTVGAPPANSPAPGVYQLRAGSDTAAGDATTYRTNATPFSIAARVDAAIPPLLSGVGPHSLNGMGFVAGHTEVLLDTVPLTEIATTPPGAGEFNVDASGTVITFQAPSTLKGRYTVRVRVNQVESTPAWWIDL